MELGHAELVEEPSDRSDLEETDKEDEMDGSTTDLPTSNLQTDETFLSSDTTHPDPDDNLPRKGGMKILETQSAVLTNYEVLSHLKEHLTKPRTTPRENTNVTAFHKQVINSLSPPSTSHSPIPPYENGKYSNDGIRALVFALEPYKLYKTELVMIFNHRPDTLSLLDCVVEQCDERFTAEQQDEILRIIGNVLGRKEGDADKEGANGIHGEVANGNDLNGSNGKRDREGEMGEDGPL